MQHIVVTAPNGPIPGSYVLVPQTDGERQELIDSLDDQGVRNSMSFIKNGINGRLDMPSDPQFDMCGAMRLSITVKDETQPRDGWFWVVECNGCRHAYWSLQPDIDTFGPWD